MNLFDVPKRKGRSNAVKRGTNARNSGIAFEEAFRSRAQFQGFKVTKMEDGCRQVGRKLIRVKTAFDWVMTYQGRAVYVDTKTCEGKAFAHSRIEIHQAYALHEHENGGAKAGYIVQLCEIDKVIFIPASVLMSRIRDNKPGSITPECEGVITLGTCASFDLRKIFE